jgi:hypothetical protein
MTGRAYCGAIYAGSIACRHDFVAVTPHAPEATRDRPTPSKRVGRFRTA